VRRDAAAAVHHATAIRLVGRTHLLAGVRLVRVGLHLHELTIHELARTLNGPAARRIPLARGELERVAAVEVVDALHQAFAEARLTDDERTVMILERTS